MNRDCNNNFQTIKQQQCLYIKKREVDLHKLYSYLYQELRKAINSYALNSENILIISCNKFDRNDKKQESDLLTEI